MKPQGALYEKLHLLFRKHPFADRESMELVAMEAEGIESHEEYHQQFPGKLNELATKVQLSRTSFMLDSKWV
jgi:hypothetical protein